MLPSATSLEGKRVPNVTFKTRVNDQWKDVTTDDVFSGRTVVAFGLPGAYTPTCSSAHLPRYNELADVFRANACGLALRQRRQFRSIRKVCRHEYHLEPRCSGVARRRNSYSRRTSVVELYRRRLFDPHRIAWTFWRRQFAHGVRPAVSP